MTPTHDHSAHEQHAAAHSGPHAEHAHEARRQGDAHHTEHAGHDRHAGHSVAMFRDKFSVSVLLMLPTLVWGHMLPSTLGFTPPHVPGAHWIPAIFGSAV